MNRTRHLYDGINRWLRESNRPHVDRHLTNLSMQYLADNPSASVLMSPYHHWTTNGRHWHEWVDDVNPMTAATEAGDKR